MTTRIFFENATTYTFTLINSNGTIISPIAPNGVYGLKLPYSQSWNTQYTMAFNGTNFTFWLGVGGQITQISPNGQIYVVVESEERTVPSNGQPYQVKTSGQVYAQPHLQGQLHNKLRITPINNMYATVTPQFAPYTPDWVVRLDFTG